MKLTQPLAIVVGASLVLGGLLLTAGPSSAAVVPGPGIGDVSAAIRYDISDPSAPRVIGDEMTSISEADDETQKIDAPWALNFFGTRYAGICVTSNGVVAPLVAGTDSCDDSYNDPIGSLAESQGGPILATFANDNDTESGVYAKDFKVTNLVLATVGGNTTATVTTDRPIDFGAEDIRSFYVVDSAIDNGSTDYRPDDFWADDLTVTAKPSATSFQMDVTGVTNLPADGTYAIETGWAFNANGDDLNGTDDGVGKVSTIYQGTTTVDGKDAWVMTNYRSTSHNGNNAEILTNTFQLVLIKEPTVNGDVDGYNFTLEYNYGTVQDGEEGYTADGADDCLDDGGMTCRTGVGLATWDAATSTADVYELFGNVASTYLMDWDVSGMTNNSLNSRVLGRYTFTMTDGVVENFTEPAMDGSATDGGALPPADGGGDTGGGGTGTDDTDTDAAALAATGQESGIIGMLGGLTLLLGAALIIRARIRRGSIQ